MKINWAVRLKNKAFLAALFALIITFVYDMAALLGLAPGVEESALIALCNTALTVLCGMGVLTDPTTKGVSDSERAMTYEEPQ